jgi:hypothetical protein
MTHRLTALIARQRGAFTRAQAIKSGLTERECRSLIGPRGPWIRVRYGVYTTRELWSGLDADGRARLVDRAVLLVCNDATALSHSSSARVRMLPLYDASDGLAHATRLGPGQSNRVEAGIKHHTGDLGSPEIEVVDGLRVVSLPRTVLGITSEFGYHSGIVTADAVLHAGLPRAELVEVAERLEHHAGAPTMRAVAADADGRAQTPIESLARVLLRGMGIADVQPQFVVRLRNGRRAEVDLYSERFRHVFETDGRLKYVDQVDMFGRKVKADEVVWLEKKREDQVRSTGLGFSRLLWHDVQPDAFQRTSARLWEEIHDQADARRLPPSA